MKAKNNEKIINKTNEVVDLLMQLFDIGKQRMNAIITNNESSDLINKFNKLTKKIDDLCKDIEKISSKEKLNKKIHRELINRISKGSDNFSKSFIKYFMNKRHYSKMQFIILRVMHYHLKIVNLIHKSTKWGLFR